MSINYLFHPVSLRVSGICLWMLAIQFAYAQTPGYLGLQNQISFNISGFPSLLDSNSTINSTFKVGIYHVWSRNTSSGFYVQNCATQMGYISEETKKYGRVKINGWGAGVAHRWYYFHTRGVNAPIGMFQELGITYIQYNMFDRYGNFLDTPSPEINKDLGSNAHLVLHTSLTSQKVIYEYIMIHYGVNIGYVLPDIFHKQSNRQLQELSIRRMRKFYAFSLSGGIGFLLF